MRVRTRGVSQGSRIRFKTYLRCILGPNNKPKGSRIRPEAYLKVHE